MNKTLLKTVALGLGATLLFGCSGPSEVTTPVTVQTSAPSPQASSSAEYSAPQAAKLTRKERAKRKAALRKKQYERKAAHEAAKKAAPKPAPKPAAKPAPVKPSATKGDRSATAKNFRSVTVTRCKKTGPESWDITYNVNYTWGSVPYQGHAEGIAAIGDLTLPSGEVVRNWTEFSC